MDKQEKTTEELVDEITNLTTERDKFRNEKDAIEKTLNEQIEVLKAERDKYKTERDEANNNLISMQNISSENEKSDFDKMFGGLV